MFSLKNLLQLHSFGYGVFSFPKIPDFYSMDNNPLQF